MKYAVFLFLLTCLTTQPGFSQWVQTNGPTGGSCDQIVLLDEYVIVNGSRGIYRSSDKMETWERMNKGLPVDVVAFNMVMENGKIYIVTPDGVYFSADAGSQWTLISPPFTAYSIEVAGNEIYAGYSEGGVYYSGDHGATWELRNPDNQGFRQVTALAKAGNTLWIGASDGLYTSNNQGKTWIQSGLGYTDVRTVLRSNGAMLIMGSSGSGAKGHLSLDNGQTWRGVAMNWETYPFTGFFRNGSEVFVSGAKGIHYSTDGGNSWSVHDYPPGSVYNWRPSIAGSGDELFATYGSGALYSSDKGLTWERRNVLLRNHYVRQIKQTNDAIVSLSEISGVFASYDEGNSWIERNVSPNEISRIIHAHQDVIIMVVQRKIYRSTNGGVTWNEILNLEGDPTGYDGIVAMAGYGDSVLVLGFYGAYFSADYGSSWSYVSKQQIGITDQSYFCYLKQDTAIVVSEKNLFFSFDFGKTWEKRNGPQTFYNTTDFFLGPSVWFMSSWNGLYVSEDQSNSWRQLDCLPGEWVLDMLPIGNSLFIATETGVFRSTNNGLDWHPFNQGLHGGMISTLARVGDYTYAGTFGRSVWRIPTNELLEERNNTAPEKPILTESCKNISITNYSHGSIEWIRNGNVVQQGGINFSPSESGTYSVSIRTGCTVIKSDALSIVILSPTLKKDCTTITVRDHGGRDIQWYFNDKEVNDANGIQLTAAQPGNYHVVVGDGCDVVQSPVVTLVGNDFKIDPPEIKKDCSRLFVANPNGYEIKWFREGAIIPATGTQLDNVQPGTYTASFSNGCISADSEPVMMETPTLVVYNIVTMNGDGKNDYYHMNDDLVGSEFRVFDRRGMLIYSSPSYQNDWYPDAGKIIPGVYFYLIESVCYGPLKGTLTLFR